MHIPTDALDSPELLPKSMQRELFWDLLPRIHRIEQASQWVLLVNVVALAAAAFAGEWLLAESFGIFVLLSGEYWSGAGVLAISGYHVRLFKKCWIRKLLLAVPAALFLFWIRQRPIGDEERISLLLVGLSTVVLAFPTFAWKGLTDPFIAKEERKPR